MQVYQLQVQGGIRRCIRLNSKFPLHFCQTFRKHKETLKYMMASFLPN